MITHWFSTNNHEWYDLSNSTKWWQNDDLKSFNWDANDDSRDVKRVFDLMTQKFDEKIFRNYFAIISSETFLSMMFVDTIIYFI